MSDPTPAPVPDASADGQPAAPAPEQAAFGMPKAADEAATSPVEEIIETAPEPAPVAEVTPELEPAVEPAQEPAPAEAAPEPVAEPIPIVEAVRQESAPIKVAPATPEAVIQGAPERAGDKVDTEPTPQSIFPETAAVEPEPAPAEAAPTAEPAVAQPGVVASPSDLPVTGKRPDGLALDKGERLIAAMGYIGILALIPLLLRRDSEFCRHHGPQALVVFVILMIAEIIGRLFGFVLPWFHAFTIIVMLVAWIVGFALAFQGQWFRIPTIFDWSRQLNLFAKEASNEERLKNDNES